MIKHSAVAWSFGKSGRGESAKYRNPGPGAYTSGDVSLYKTKAPHWKLGSAKRSHSFRGEVPGPGNYEIKSKIGVAPKYTMRPKTGTSLDIKNRELPGPGAYDPDVKKVNDYKYTLRIRPNSASIWSGPNNPGPGTYQLRKLDSDLLNKHGVKFGYEKKLKEPDFTYIKSPGPGNYEFDRQKVNQSAPKFSFGKELRGNEMRPKTPGPGSYELKPKLGAEAPKISMSFYRPLSSVPQESPGPGAYQPNLKNKNKSPEYKIGSSKREIVDKETKLKPGPGTYNPDKVDYVKSKAPQWVMGSEPRGDMTSSAVINNPGPGNYEYKKTVGEGPKVLIFIQYSLTGKNFYNPDRLGGPGPGQYDNNKVGQIKVKEPSWRIGTSSREDIIKKVKRENLPGPGNYQIPSRALEGKKYMFGKQSRGENYKSFVPGPGQYHIPTQLVDVPKYQTYSSGFKEEFRYI